MKFLFLIIVSVLCIANSKAQKHYWQQQVNYTIDVKLNDTLHTLDGYCAMEYSNNSPDTLRYIWIHLWMNAFKNDKTAFTQQAIQNGDLDFYFSKENERGYINRLNFQSNGKSLSLEDHPNYIDIVKIVLAEPILPNTKAVITTPFHVKIPKNFSRGGHVGQSYQVTQWFPKAAMYDAQGWHEMPYVDQGEYYSNFGDYEVNITLPQNYVVAATGELMTETEKQFLASRANFQMPKQDKMAPKKNTDRSIITSALQTKTIQYVQKNVVDFAWFADKSFIVKEENANLKNGNIVKCFAFYRPKNSQLWEKAAGFAKRAIEFRSELIGNYPYNIVSVVDGPLFAGGGMEYPTITIIGNMGNSQSLDEVIEHEVGHNWFQAILATNERMHPWLDEGVNSYYDYLYTKKYYPKNDNTNKKLLRKISTIKPTDVVYALHKDQPINSNSYQLKSYNYGIITYMKTSEWLQHIASKTSETQVVNAIKNYYETWKFKHPSPTDFDNALKTINNYEQFAALRNATGPLETKKKNISLITPALGYNRYNGIMLGAGINNYAPSQSKIKFYVAPMFATKTKTLTGLGGIMYSNFPTVGPLHSYELGVNAATFGNNYFENDRAQLQMKFLKIVPFVRVKLKEKNSRSTIEKTIQLKHYNIQEDNLNFTLVQNPGDTFYNPSIAKENRYINQLQFSIKNWAALYPYQLQLQVEQNKDLVRTTITAQQFFHYNAKGDGLQVRLFAGKISYFNKTLSTRFENDRYALNLLAPKGDEDYTYSTYFLKRNAFDNGAAKQILNRDGAFRFRTDLLANKPGRTDNWLAAANFTSSLPDRLNPLSMLPIKIPIKLFMDIGTNAEAWQKNYAGTKFLYNGGLQLSLLKNTIEIYYPFIYSKEFSDYSLQMWQKKISRNNISFAINLNQFSLKKVIPQINY